MNIIRILTIVLVLTILNSIFTIALKSENIVNLESGGGGTPDCEDSDDCTSRINPKCDNEVCVGCVLGDDDVCSKFPGFPWCRTDGNCVECLTHDQCPYGEGFCDNNVCRPCLDEDCEADQICDPNSRKCVPDTTETCTVTTEATDCDDYANGERCLSGICGYPPLTAPTPEGIPEEQPFPVFNFYNIIISILILFGYYIRKIYR